MAPKGIELASAYISVGLNTDGVGRELNRFVRGIKDIEIDIDANVRPASTGVGRWRKDEESNEVNIDVDADTKGAAANVARWRATERARPVKIRVDADTGRARREVDALSSNLFKFGRSDVLKLNLGAAAITSLPALASGLAEVAAGIQQVAQAGLALPGIMAGATSSIGTLVFGLSGVGDAYDAMNKAADDAAKSGGDVAAQQRAQQSASFGLRNAIVDEVDARKDVNRAIRDTIRGSQDLRLEMRGGVISEKRAVHELAKARQRLYTGDFSDYTDAVLDVQEAELRVDEVRTRNQRTAAELTEANAKGVMGSDEVVAANERLIRSQQGVAQAQAAVAAAVPGASAAQENAALAMSKISPKAQDFVDALIDAQGPIQKLKFLVQDNIFDGLDKSLLGLANKSMPMLEKGLGGIGDAWNNTFQEILRVAGTDETQGILSRIFGNTEDAQNILNDAIEPLTQGLGVLSEAGSRALPRLAQGFVTVSDRFANFITKADESGKLDEWIGESITALGHLGETALNVGKMFTGITNAADGSFLENLERWTTSWQTWLNSAEGQNTLREIFDEGKRVFNEWKPILEDIPGLFKGIYDGASAYIGGVLEIVRPVTDFLSEHPDLVKAAATAYLAFKSAQVLGSIATLGGALDGLSDKFGSPGKGGKGLLGQLSMFAAGAVLLQEVGDTGNWARLWEELFGESPLPDMFKNMMGDRAPAQNTGAPGVPYGNVQGPGARQMPLGAGPAIPSNVPSVSPGQNPLTAIAAPAGSTYGLPRGTDTGGYGSSGAVFPAWVHELEKRFGIKASTYAGHQESNRNEAGYAPNPQGLNRGIDWSGPVENMQRFADYLSSVSGSLEQVIWQNPSTGSTVTVAGGAPVNGYYDAGTLADHRNHVHTRQSAPIPLPRPAPVLGPSMVAAPPSGSTNPNLDDFLFSRVPKYDQGGPWPPGTLGINTTGQHEFVLNPEDIEYLKSQGIDPASLQSGGSPIDPATTVHGTSAGGAPGPQGVPRTEGYIPAAAGNPDPVGQGGLSNFLDLGESFFHNLIDSGAQLGSMAVSAAAAAGSFGAGAAAGPAASAGIQMGAEAAKRGVSYLYDLGGIWGEAAIEQLFPFGAPRWLGSANPMAFMPQGLPQTGEKKAPGTMGAAKTAIQSWAQPGNPAMANGTAQQGASAALAEAKVQPSYGQPPTQPAPPTQPPPVDPMNPATWLNYAGIFDNGGVLPPKSLAANLSKTPEYVFTQRQMATMQKNAATTVIREKQGGEVHFHAQDNDAMWRRYQWEQRRAARRYNGRP